MSLNKTTAELQAELDDLVAEREKLKARKAELATELQSVDKRLGQLQPGWQWAGLVAEKRREMENSKYPIYDGEGTHCVTRIVDVTDKYFILRCDNDKFDQTDSYHKHNGWKIRKKSNNGAIDPVKALQIWEAHKAGL